MLITKLLETVRKHKMFFPGEKVLVAVSGGPDSVALLHALWTLKDDFGISLHVAHLNHGIRGKDAEKDAEFTADLAKRLGVPFAVETVDVPALRKKLRLSMEEAARKARYEFLDRVADRIGAARVATAHTADDQAETVLMNLIRGSGLEGLAGIPPVRGRYIRPLLAVSREDVLEYCSQNGLDYRIDVSNLRADYTRNNIRLKLIPLLESDYNAGVKSVLASTAEIAREEADFLSDAARKFLEISTVNVGKEEVVFDLDRFLEAPNALQRRCVRLAVEMVKGDLRDVAFRQIERVIDRLDKGKDFTLTLPSGVIYALRAGSAFRIYRTEPEIEAADVAVDLPIPGTVEIPLLNVAVEAEELPKPADIQRAPNTLEIVIDRDRIVSPLTVRNWRKGDRIQPFGMTGSKKLSDLFVDAKIPRRQRRLAPIVADKEKIVWVVGLAISEQVGITKETRGALRISCVRMAES